MKVSMKIIFSLSSFAIFLVLLSAQASFASNLLTLNDYLKLAQDKSPDIGAAQALKKEAHARAEGVRMPPPMVGFINLKDSVSSANGFEITQEVPFPTKIYKESELRHQEALSQDALFSYKENELLLDARWTYFRFWKSFEALKILEEKQSWLKKHLQLTRSTARYNTTAQSYLLGVESESDLIENEILENQSEFSESKNMLKIYAPDLSTENLTPVEPTVDHMTVNTNQQDSSYLTWKESELKVAETSQSLSKQSYWPDITLKYRSMQASQEMPRSQEIMIGLSLPFLFFWQPQAEVSMASARKLRAETELRKARIEFGSRLNGLKAKALSLEKQLSTLKDKLVPRAKKRVQMLENLSLRSIENLNEHRTIMLSYLDLRTKEIDVRIELEKIFIEISKLTQKKD